MEVTEVSNTDAIERCIKVLENYLDKLDYVIDGNGRYYDKKIAQVDRVRVADVMGELGWIRGKI